MDNIVILMTACVYPKNMIQTIVQDPGVRKRQYLDAINYYLQETDFDIVFCDNSDVVIWDEIIHQDKAHRLEYLTFNGGEKDKDRGKGYGEANIIKYALSHSCLLREARYVIKITGRVKVLNINNIRGLLSKKKISKVVVSLCSDIGLILSSVCVCATKTWLQWWVDNYMEDIRYGEGATFEDVLFKSFVDDSNVQILRFNPIFDGICAGTGKPYGNQDEISHKHIHYSKLCRMYGLRGDSYHYIITWVIWKWYGVRCRVRNILKLLYNR